MTDFFHVDGHKDYPFTTAVESLLGRVGRSVHVNGTFQFISDDEYEDVFSPCMTQRDLELFCQSNIEKYESYLEHNESAIEGFGRMPHFEKFWVPHGDEIAFQLDDGGRAAAGYKGKARDCVVRAISIAEGRDYSDVYRDLGQASKQYASTHNNKVARKIEHCGSSPRNGVFKEVYMEYLKSRGWRYISHGANRLDLRLAPFGRVIIRTNKHLVTMLDHVIHDSFDSRWTNFYGEPQLIKAIGYFIRG